MEHRIREKWLYNLSNLHRRLFYLLLILIPTQLGYHVWPDFAFVNGIRVDYLAPTVYLTDLIILGIATTWLAQKIRNSNTEIRNKLEISNSKYKILILGLLFFILNILFSFIPQLALLKLFTLVKLAFLTFYIVKTRPDFKISVGCLLVAACWSSAIAWIQIINQSSIGGLMWFLGERTFSVGTPGIATAIIHDKLILRPYGTFPHPNVLAGFLVVLFPLVLNTLSSVSKKITVPLSVFLLLTLVITFSRSAWIVAGILLIVMLMSNQHYVKIHKSPSGIGMALTILIIGLLPILSERFLNLSSVDMQSITRRMDLNYAAMEMVTDYPLFGVGLNNFLVTLPHYLKINSYQDIQPAHNIYLLLVAEWGIVGFALIMFLIYKFFTRIHSIQYEILLPISALLFLGLFDHYPYTIHQMQLLFAVLIGCAISLSSNHRHHETDKKNSQGSPARRASRRRIRT
ncbi:O-antigen ligase family protein [Candidatus Roizmanbacteria bacterium]|nr:O-antigen ligase family protein [Candidatus Roizmanbacteria bacterium]